MPESDGSLIGRDGEQERVRAAVAAVLEGQPRAVLITGEAGIGKTALVERSAATLSAEGWATAVGRAVRMDGGTPPYLPFVEILETLLADLEPARARVVLGSAREELAGLLPGTLSTSTRAAGVTAETPSHDPLRRARLFEAMLDIGERLAIEHPVAIIVEDLQWVDAASADLLRFLVDRAEHGRLLLIATARLDGGTDAMRPRRLLTDLAHRRGTDWIELAPLGRTAVARLLRGLLGVAPPSALVDDIARRSGGNPLMVEELTTAYVGGRPVSANLRESVLARVAGLSGSAAIVLRTAALVTEPLDEARLGTITGMDIVDVADAMRALLSAQIVVLRDEGAGRWLYFRNEIVREIVADTLLPDERRALHRAIATAAEGWPAVAAVSPASAAYHWAGAGDEARANAAAVLAHRAALEVAAYDEALRWGQVALDGRPSDGDPADRIGLLRSMASAALLAGDPRRAADLDREALVAMPPGFDRDIRFETRGAYRVASFAAGDPTAARADALAVLAEVPTEPPDPFRAEALAHLAALALARRDWPEARRLALDALALAEKADDQARVALATGILGLALAELGEEDVGLAAVRRAWSMASIAGARGYDLAYRRLVNLEARLGRYEEALDIARRGREVAATIGLARTLGRSLSADEADALVQLGRWTEAEALLEQALVEEPGDDDAERLRIASARLRLRRDGPDAARAELALALAGSDPPGRTPAGSSGMATASVRRSWVAALELTAEAAILDHRAADALRLLDAAAPEARAIGDAAPLIEPGICLEPVAALALWAATEPRPNFDDPSPSVVRDVVRDLVEMPIGPFAGVIAAWAARIDGDPAEAATRWTMVQGQMASLGLGWWQAWGAVFEAEAATALGRHDRAAQALANASLVATDLGSMPLQTAVSRLARRLGLPLPGKTGSPSSRSGGAVADHLDSTRVRVLSEREQEVLELLVEGFTNREIGERLAISHKTASVHVTHILDKLEVENRTEAAAVAVRLGLVGGPRGTEDPRDAGGPRGTGGRK